MKKTLVVLSLVMSSAWAVNTNPLLEEAKRLMNYHEHIAPPKTTPTTRKELQSMYCPGRGCSVSAVYVNDQIYYDKRIDLSDVYDRSIMIHEYIHHIQRETRGRTLDCKTWFEKERQAYDLQIKYLRDHQIKTDSIDEVVKKLKCPRQEEL
jgi:hypothetical protein